MKKRKMLEKDEDGYDHVRARNNEAVRKSRDRKRAVEQETEQRVAELRQENQELEKKVDSLNKELQFLKEMFVAYVGGDKKAQENANSNLSNISGQDSTRLNLAAPNLMAAESVQVSSQMPRGNRVSVSGSKSILGANPTLETPPGVSGMSLRSRISTPGNILNSSTTGVPITTLDLAATLQQSSAGFCTNSVTATQQPSNISSGNLTVQPQRGSRVIQIPISQFPALNLLHKQEQQAASTSAAAVSTACGTANEMQIKRRRI